MRTKTWPRSPGINVATHKSQSCCLSWCSCFAECGSKSPLMSGGAGGCAQGRVHCRWLYKCLCAARGCQGSISHACCRTARASLHLLKRSFDAATWAHFWGCEPACFLPSPTAYPACETSILATNARQHKQPVAAQRTLCRSGGAYTMGPKLGPLIWTLGY